MLECSMSISEPVEISEGNWEVTIDYYPDSRSFIFYNFKSEEEANEFVRKFKGDRREHNRESGKA